MSGCPSSGVFPVCSAAHRHESWPSHPPLLPAWFASITTASFLPKTCLPLASLHISSCQVFGLETTSPVSQTFLFYTLKSLWNLACLPKLSLSSLVTLLNIKHFYCIKPCWKGKRKKGKEKKENPRTQREGSGRHYIAGYHVSFCFVLVSSRLHTPWACYLCSSLGVSHTEKSHLVSAKGVVSRLNRRVLEMGKPIPLLMALHHFLKRNLFS